MNNLAQFKKNNSFTSLCNKFGIYLSSSQTNICPKCNHKSLTIKDEERYKCFYPHCELNKSGDIFNFLEIMKISKNFNESLKILGLSNSNNLNNKNNYSRHSLLTEVFLLYKKEFKKNEEGINYLKKRGYEIPSELEIGLAPKQDNFLSINLPTKVNNLRKEGLIKLNGLDYFCNSIVFPLRNIEGRIQHFHSRIIKNNLNSNSENLRWIASKSTETSDSNINYLWNGYKERNSKALFLTEGISDGLSLISWKLPTISTMSIQADFKSLLSPFEKLEELHCIFDNDRMTINNSKYSYTYKSWEFIIPKLIDYKLSYPNVSIFCLMPPDRLGIKDLNNWFEQSTLQEFQLYYENHTKTLTEFVFDLYKDREDKQLLLLKLCKIENKFKIKYEKYITEKYKSWVDYLSLIKLI